MGGDFDGAGTKAGLEVWRIEKLVPTLVKPKFHGHFFEGDAYIVLKTSSKPQSSSLIWDIFFWLGKECSTDEAGVAALKTVELDESLGGGPVQHREVQGHESDMFLQLFASVQYEPGGVASGFKHVDKVHTTRLLHCKGKREVRVKLVPLSASSLNAGDVFVLDLGKKIIQWNGSEANKKEKVKALEVCEAINGDERGGKATIEACEQGSEPAEFWTALGGQGAVAPATSDEVSAVPKGELKLIKVSDASGQMEETVVGEEILTKGMLTTEDVFIMDNVSEIFVWIGKRCSTDERKRGMQIAQDYCSAAGRPAGTQLSKVMEGTEPTTFKANFSTWDEPTASQDYSMTPRGNVAMTPRGSSIADQLGGLFSGLGNALKRVSIGSSIPHDGLTQVWRIEGFEMAMVDESLIGQFFAGDSYIVKYTYEKDGKPLYIIYIWQGRQSSADEKGASAILAVKMDNELGGGATQIRVPMYREPGHFVRIFKGKMVVHSGGKGSGFKNRQEKDEADADGVSLFHVRGTNADDTRAVQVDERADQLNSGDCFVLLTPGTMYIWKGSGSNETEQGYAKSIAKVLGGSRLIEEVAEGSEPEDFWSKLGGKAEYTTAKWLPPSSRDPMLFSMSNASGAIKIERVFDFTQEDLDDEDVFILDVYTAIFLWVGEHANESEKAAAVETAAEYLKAMKLDPETPVVTVKSGKEPEMFQAFFLGWDESKRTSFTDPYQAKLAKIMAANPPPPEPLMPVLKKTPTKPGAPAPPPEPTPPPAAPAAPAAATKPPDGKYTLNYEELKKSSVELAPLGLDLSKREQYLSDQDFVKVLGSPRGEFNAMKAWKQNQLKKAAGLF